MAPMGRVSDRELTAGPEAATPSRGSANLEAIPRRRSRLKELDRLSEAMVRMAAALAHFATFIPTDVVASLLTNGMRAEPGGDRRGLTLLFVDLAGFTALSARLGDRVIPLIGGFLKAAS